MQKKNYVGFSCGVEVGQEFWFPSVVGNALLCWREGRIDFIAEFPEMYKNLVLYADVKVYKSKLFFIPFSASAIAVYDLENKTLDIVPWSLKKNRLMFYTSEIHGKYMYLFPNRYKGIVKIDLDSYTIEILTEWITDVSKYIVEEEKAFFATRGITVDNEYYIPFRNAHAILKFNFENDSYHIYSVGTKGYSTMVRDGDNFWLMSSDGKSIFAWEERTENIRCYESFPKQYCPDFYRHGLYYNNKCYFFPDNQSMILSLDCKTGEIEENRYFENIANISYSQHSISRHCVLFVLIKNYELILCFGKASKVIRFDLLSEKIIYETRLKMPEKYVEKYQMQLQKNFLRNESIRNKYMEKKEYGIRNFIAQKVQIGSERKEEQIELSKGYLIYQKCKACLEI